MQRTRDRGRIDHAAACGRGMAGFAAAYRKIKPDWVVVLGDRIEAFAAASAASIGGIAVCHIHGGDRAEGIADEAMRHAITKLSHLHCAASKQSAERILKMGESKPVVFATGSPAIDGLKSIKPMENVEAERLGSPRAVVLMHPAGLSAEEEFSFARDAVICAREALSLGRAHSRETIFRHILLLSPNADPGREHILRNWKEYERLGAHFEPHLPRSKFLSLLVRLREQSGCLVGNSSAGLIEAAALRVPVLNFGPRQAGRESGRNVTHCAQHLNPEAPMAIWSLRENMRHGVPAEHPYGDGRASPRIAALLAKIDPHDPALLRKRNSY